MALVTNIIVPVDTTKSLDTFTNNPVVTVFVQDKITDDTWRPYEVYPISYINVDFGYTKYAVRNERGNVFVSENGLLRIGPNQFQVAWDTDENREIVTNDAGISGLHIEIVSIGRDIVNLNDFSEYDSDLCNNGGQYGFWESYKRMENGMWQKSYHTTAEFDYCPCCGSWGNHYVSSWLGEDEECETEFQCGNYEEVTSEQLEEIISNFEKKHADSNGFFVEYVDRR